MLIALLDNKRAFVVLLGLIHYLFRRFFTR
jgi:hypothetical protein